MARRKVKKGEKSPWGQDQTSSKRSPPFWLLIGARTRRNGCFRRLQKVTYRVTYQHPLWVSCGACDEAEFNNNGFRVESVSSSFNFFVYFWVLRGTIFRYRLRKQLFSQGWQTLSLHFWMLPLF